VIEVLVVASRVDRDFITSVEIAEPARATGVGDVFGIPVNGDCDSAAITRIEHQL
jgi:hypothetical protein